MNVFFLLPFAAGVCSLLLVVISLLRRAPTAATWCFCAGMVALGLDSTFTGLSLRAAQQGDVVGWLTPAFVANSFVFLFLGIGGNTFLNRLRGASVSDLSYIASAVVAVIVARVAVVYGLIALFNRCSKAERIDWRYQTIMFWGGGLRGALPLVLALSIPVTFLQRQLVLDLTAGVVLFSLLVQGMSVGRLIRSVQPR